jgi:DDE superfamily endonuclease
VVRTWARRGQTPTLRVPFNWKKLSAIVAVSTDLRLVFELIPGAFTGPRVLCFLVDLIGEMGRPFVLLWDGAPAHRSGEIADFLRRPDVRARLEVHRFPPYAPELNPAEWIFSDVKGHSLANFCPETLGKLAEEAGGALTSLGEDEKKLAALLLGSELPLREKDIVKYLDKDQ